MIFISVFIYRRNVPPEFLDGLGSLSASLYPVHCQSVATIVTQPKSVQTIREQSHVPRFTFNIAQESSHDWVKPRIESYVPKDLRCIYTTYIVGYYDQKVAWIMFWT